MKTDLTREQIMLIVDRARHQRSIAAGNVSAAYFRQAALWLGHSTDRFLHLLLMSPTAHR